MVSNKIVVVLLIVAILFSIGSIVVSMGFDASSFSGNGANINTKEIVTSDSGNVGVEILTPPVEGNGS